MKAINKNIMRRKRPESPPAIQDAPQPSELPDPPVVCQDIPQCPPEISQSEIVAYETALHHYRLAKADFERKRSDLALKLLQLCHCQEGHYFAFLDDAGNLVVENHTSLAPVTRRPVIDRTVVPVGGAA
jgi:hypothetical protein